MNRLIYCCLLPPSRSILSLSTDLVVSTTSKQLYSISQMNRLIYCCLLPPSSYTLSLKWIDWFTAVYYLQAAILYLSNESTDLLLSTTSKQLYSISQMNRLIYCCLLPPSSYTLSLKWIDWFTAVYYLQAAILYLSNESTDLLLSTTSKQLYSISQMNRLIYCCLLPLSSSTLSLSTDLLITSKNSHCKVQLKKGQ